MTNGGFYAHFRSRDELVAAGIREMFLRATAAPFAALDPRETLAAYLDFDLSRAHRDRLSATRRQERTRSKWRPFDLAGSSAGERLRDQSDCAPGAVATAWPHAVAFIWEARQ